MKHSRLPYLVTTAFLAAAFGCQPDDNTPLGPEAVSDASDTPDLAEAATGWVVRRDMPGPPKEAIHAVP